MFDAIGNQTIIVTPLAGAMPSAQLAIDGLKHNNVDALLLIPSFLEIIASSSDMLDYFTSKVKTVFSVDEDNSES